MGIGFEKLTRFAGHCAGNSVLACAYRVVENQRVAVANLSGITMGWQLAEQRLAAPLHVGETEALG